MRLNSRILAVLLLISSMMAAAGVFWLGFHEGVTHAHRSTPFAKTADTVGRALDVVADTSNHLSGAVGQQQQQQQQQQGGGLGRDAGINSVQGQPQQDHVEPLLKQPNDKRPWLPGPVAPRDISRQASNDMVSAAARAVDKPAPDVVQNPARDSPKPCTVKKRESAHTLCSEFSDLKEGDAPLLCIGVVSAYRPVSMVVDFMCQLMGNVNRDCVEVIVHQAKSASGLVNERAEMEKMGVTVRTDITGHPDIETGNLPLSLGDSLDRVRWRTTHVLDYANTLEECVKTNASYILALEDDLKSTRDSIAKIFQSLRQLPDKNFGYAAFYSGDREDPGIYPVSVNDEESWWFGLLQHGAVSLLFRKQRVIDMIPILREKALERPIDWLVPGIMGAHFKLPNWVVFPSFFQHLGNVSTFSENKDRHKLRSPTFEE